MWASDDWLEFCGFSGTEVVGQTFKMIQGPATDKDTIVALMDAVSRLDSINLRLTNYTRHGIPFRHDIEVQPLNNSLGEAVLYRVRSSNITPIVDTSPIEQGVVTSIDQGVVTSFPFDQTAAPLEAPLA